MKRNYDDVNKKVLETYKLNHEKQTLAYSVEMYKQYCTEFNRACMGLWDAIELCNQIVDESDPDINLPQIYHAIQTAENLRQKFPDRKDLHLVGLIHDLGKVMLLDQFGKLPQWSVVGDIYPVGVQFHNKIVFSQFFENNPDIKNDQFNTEYGIYSPHCGLDHVIFGWSHDTYLYNILLNNPNCKIPIDSLKLIKYHSFYAFHKENEYHHLANNDDIKILKPMLQEFSQCDLYSKDDTNKLNIDDYKPYYQSLIEEYCPGTFKW